MPLAPPVMRATRPSKSVSVIAGVYSSATRVAAGSLSAWIRSSTTRSESGGPTSCHDPRRHAARRGHAGGPARRSRRRPTTCARRRRRCCGRRPSRAPPAARSSPRTSSAPPSWRALPDDEVLAVYTALRPRRATADELETIAQHLGGGVRAALRGLRARGGRRARRARPAAERRVSDDVAQRAVPRARDGAAPARDADPRPSRRSASSR